MCWSTVFYILEKLNGWKGDLPPPWGEKNKKRQNMRLWRRASPIFHYWWPEDGIENTQQEVNLTDGWNQYDPHQPAWFPSNSMVPTNQHGSYQTSMVLINQHDSHQPAWFPSNQHGSHQAAWLSPSNMVSHSRCVPSKQCISWQSFPPLSTRCLITFLLVLWHFLFKRFFPASSIHNSLKNINTII